MATPLLEPRENREVAFRNRFAYRELRAKEVLAGILPLNYARMRI
jgi:hypothetical protein